MSSGLDLTVRPGAGPARAAVLVLHGGRAESHEPTRSRHLSVVRLAPFARAIHAIEGPRGVAVASLRYRVRGWNGSEESPVADARWALDQLAEQLGPVPVVLVGHSMGGRTALRLADHPAVVGIVALAPWLPPGEPRVPLGRRPLLVVHGTADRWTDPAESRAYVEAAVAAGSPAQWIPMAGHGHFMLRDRAGWRDLVTDFVTGLVGQTVPSAGPNHAGSTEAGEPPTADRPGRPRS
ncbi:MAG: alpha/beta hydrolase [Sporichthyaceae bacterium]